ncbi:IGEB protein, partial [Chaetorhynchus papuensis]|nr:IGEB protein [Chaetorhynchus papuensis]
ISHVTGIPHSPMGQEALVERAHQTIKRMLLQQKGGVEVETPAVRLARVLFTLNFLNCSEKEPDLPVLHHFHNSTRAQLKERSLVLTKEPDSLRITGPFPFI